MEIASYQESIQLFANHNHDLGPFLIIHRLGKHFGDLSEKIQNLLADAEGNINDEDRIKLAISLGDMMNDIATMASDLGISMTDILDINIRKLQLEHKEKTNNIENFK